MTKVVSKRDYDAVFVLFRRKKTTGIALHEPWIYVGSYLTRDGFRKEGSRYNRQEWDLRAVRVTGETKHIPEPTKE